jgi:hypothetical protein
MRPLLVVLLIAALLTACDSGSSTATTTTALPTTTTTDQTLTLVEWPAVAKRFLRETIGNEGGTVESITCGSLRVETTCTVSWTDSQGYACDEVWPLKLTGQGVRTAEDFLFTCTRS